MKRIARKLVSSALKTGVTTAGTTTAAVILSRAEGKKGTAALNAISHIAWGDKGARTQKLDAKHTLVGAGLNAGAMVFWTRVHDTLFGKIARKSFAHAGAAAIATAGIAYVVDYHLVPRRFTPGFETQLSPASLLAMYGVLAATIAAGTMIDQKLMPASR